LRQCSGKALKADIDKIHTKGKAVMKAMEDDETTGSTRIGTGAIFGLLFTVFPVPEVSFFAMGTLSLTTLLGRKPHQIALESTEVEDLSADKIRALDAAIDAALTSDRCAHLRQRFELHSRGLGNSSNPVVRRSILSSRFPELRTGRRGHVGLERWTRGVYLNIGPTRIAIGGFGVAEGRAKELASSYTGCKEWRRVIDLWPDQFHHMVEAAQTFSDE